MNFFLFLDLRAVHRESIQGKFAYIWQFQQILINATKFGKMQIHFKSDVFAAYAITAAKSLEGESNLNMTGMLVILLFAGVVSFRLFMTELQYFFP